MRSHDVIRLLLQMVSESQEKNNKSYAQKTDAADQPEKLVSIYQNTRNHSLEENNF
jgi:hypothetical protein